MSRDPKQLVGGHATDTLSEDERRALMRAALDDQELFDALVENEGLRALLDEPAARQEMLAVLERQTPWERARAWFEREATLLDLAAVATVVLAAFVGFALMRPPGGRGRSAAAAARPIGAPLSPDRVAALLELPAAQAVPAGVELVSSPRPVFAPGEAMRFRLTFRAPARIVVLVQAEGRPGEQAWPGLGQAPALVPKPGSGAPAVQPLELEAPAAPGRYRLRLVVAPPDLDLGALPVEALAAAAGRLTNVDVSYEVKTP